MFFSSFPLPLWPRIPLMFFSGLRNSIASMCSTPYFPFHTRNFVSRTLSMVPTQRDNCKNKIKKPHSLTWRFSNRYCNLCVQTIKTLLKYIYMLRCEFGGENESKENDRARTIHVVQYIIKHVDWRLAVFESANSSFKIQVQITNYVLFKSFEMSTVYSTLYVFFFSSLYISCARVLSGFQCKDVGCLIYAL